MIWQIFCAILFFVCLFLIFKIYIMRKSLCEIENAVDKALVGDTNRLVTLSSNDKYIKKLVSKLNIQLCELRKLRLGFQNGDRALKDSITNISHDLRTPLTAILGYIDLLENENLSENAKRYVSQIKNRSMAMCGLTEELFSFSLSTLPRSLSFEKLDLRNALGESLVSFFEGFEKMNIKPNILLPQNPVFRKVDSSALSRIFENIISNALKYSDGDFSVSLSEEGVFRFSNSAKGLSNIEVGRLFDRFFTVDSGRKSTGLGLSIAKTLTERMNGSLEAEYKDECLIITLGFQNIA